jgi:Fic family protein
MVSQPSPNQRAGTFVRQTVAGETYEAFSPKPLPPDPPLVVDAVMQDLLDTANQALGRLDGITLLLPDADLFLSAYLRKEAVLSSQIEGTQSSLSDLLLFEQEVRAGAEPSDVRETLNYLVAMNHGLERIQGGFPLSLRLIREIHGLLMADVRGADRAPGEFRRTQNWLGGARPGNARYVPPPAHEVAPAMGALELFLHDRPVMTPILIKTALAHAQFETIHPFLDGNGRVGRLLITLLLSADGKVLSRPLLYLSLYLKRNRDEYYDRLQRIRTDGDWEAWLIFFLEGVIEVARTATETITRIVHLIENDRQKIYGLGRAAASTLRLHELAAREIYLTLPNASRRLGLSLPTVSKAAQNLRDLEIFRETTYAPRRRFFAYEAYLSILSEGTEPPS